MSQCVPSWDLDDSSIPLHHPSYAVAELAWQNGQPGLPPKPRAGTLESFVNQPTFHGLDPKSAGFNDLPPWFDHHDIGVGVGVGVGAPAVTMDALVPVRDQALEAVPDEITGGGESTRVGSCSGATVPGGVVEESESTGTCRRVREEERTTSFESWEGGSGGEGHTYASVWSQDNDSSSKDHDSSWHTTPQNENFGEEINRRKKTGKVSVSTKRTRAAAVPSQSERRRRDKINQRIKILQKMVPNSTKQVQTDKASMLDEVIEYMKQLQAQLQMTKIYMSQMVMLQQYINMSMMGMGVMDLNAASRAIGMPPIVPPPGMPNVFPLATFMPMVPWNGQGDRLSSPDFFSTLLSNQVGYDAYSKLAALYQQFQQPFAPKK